MDSLSLFCLEVLLLNLKQTQILNKSIIFSLFYGQFVLVFKQVLSTKSSKRLTSIGRAPQTNPNPGHGKKISEVWRKKAAFMVVIVDNYSEIGLEVRLEARLEVYRLLNLFEAVKN